LRQVEPFCQAFPAPDFYVSERAVNDAIMQRIPFNVIHPSSGNKVDFMVPQTNEWSATQLQRRQRSRVFPDLDIWVAAPEDVILGKLWYFSEGGSDKHLRDILGILKISGDLVDRGEVSRWAAKLGYTDLWNACLARLAGATT
jgi:hypothetical protein